MRQCYVGWFSRACCRIAGGWSWAVVFLLTSCLAQSSTNVYLAGVPDYQWVVGCFGTAGGNLMGFWDRHGFPDFYTGLTANGVAPLDSFFDNWGIRSLWASQAGVDGRPTDRPGHVDDYFVNYASAAPDPYIVLGRPEHEPDCLGDFIGLDQDKWKNLGGECDGNIDGYSFVYWDASGERRVNFTPGPEAGLPAIDIQSGLRAWTTYRGFTAEVFTQLSDFNPDVPSGKGFTFEDLKDEIDAGYPVLMFLQVYDTKSRSLNGKERANPLIHGILAYGYSVNDDGTQFVRYRTSFAGGDSVLGVWKNTTFWAGIAPLRGVITYHPQPQIKSVVDVGGRLTIRWDGPDADLYNVGTGTTSKPHWYVIEMATSLEDSDFTEITLPTTNNAVTIPSPGHGEAFFRLKMTPLPESRYE